MVNDAKWIGNGTAKPFYARKNFILKTGTGSATLSVCGLGQFEAYVNGNKVGSHVIDPGWTNYNKRVLYVDFDVTDLLQDGENVLAVTVGNGWYIADKPDERHCMVIDSQYLFPGDKGYRAYGTCLALIAKLTITGTDGSVTAIGTDETWNVRESATTLANVFGSEDFDARLYPNGYHKPGFDDKDWLPALVLPKELQPKGKLTLQTHPPVVVKEIFVPKEAGKIDGGILYDFGKNMSAMFEITASGQPGSRIRLTPVEKLKDGKPEKTVETWSVFTLCGNGIETYCPTFSYCGGRWLFAEPIASESGELPQIQGARAHRITSASTDVGRFQCSDERYNKIYALILAAIESNLNHCHTDCPQIEKLGWLEQSHLMAPSVMYTKDMRGLFAKILRDMRDEQYEDGQVDVTPAGKQIHGAGLVPAIAPTYSRVVTEVKEDGLGCVDFVDTVAWGSCIVQLPLMCYEFYGDKAFLEDNFETAERYLNYVKTQLNGDGLLDHGLGDWGAPDFSKRFTENVDTALFYHALTSMKKIACLLERESDTAKYHTWAEDVKQRYNALFLRKDNTERWCYFPASQWPQTITQTLLAIPLYVGLVPDYAEKDITEKFLSVVRADNCLNCGEIGLRFVIQMLDRLGEQELLCRLITRSEHPSYLRFCEMGETTLPEFWRDDARSRNHDMLGHIMEWFYSGMAGITSLTDAFREVSIAPWLPLDMTWLDCSYRSVRGEIRVSLKRVPDGIDAQITIPEGCKGTFNPAHLGCGSDPVPLVCGINKLAMKHSANL